MKTSSRVFSAVIVSMLGLSAALNAQAFGRGMVQDVTEASLPVKPGAVEISILGIGPPVDGLAVNKVLRTVGTSIATGVTDTYFVRGYGIEGGFSACAQKSPFAGPTDFAAFVNRLRGITPDPTVVSNAGAFRPGLILDRRDTGMPRVPVALMGKVYCWVDATRAAIGVGDLLTTAEAPGHAMKVTDTTRAIGAIIGKALAPLAAGRQLIPILVTAR